MNTTPITLPGLAAILAAGRYGQRKIARDTLAAAWPTAAERAEGIAHVRALDPDAADLLEVVSAEIRA
ncbi:MAG: hypothetical protein U0325_14070 [Polyangiales bacterium]